MNAVRLSFRRLVASVISASVTFVLLSGLSFRTGLAAPTSQPSADAEQRAMANALTALYGEYAAAQQKDAKIELRSDCDYFKKNPDPNVTSAGVLAVLERAGGNDIKLESYVRWQLLSAVAGRFDDSCSTRLLLVYKRTPALLARPGITPSSRAEMVGWTIGHTESEIDGIDNKLADQMAAVNGFNTSIARFRSELLGKMPLRYDCIAIGFDDLTARVGCGMDDWSNKEFLHLLDKIVHDWFAAKPPAGQVASLSSYAAKVAHGRGAEYFDKLTWRPEQRQLVWKSKLQPIDHDGVLEKIHKDLAAYAAANR